MPVGLPGEDVEASIRPYISGFEKEAKKEINLKDREVEKKRGINMKE